MTPIEVGIPGVRLFTPAVHRDQRGLFVEAYLADRLRQDGFNFSACQSNFSLSEKAGTVRGMHWQQDPCAQAKYVFCVSGIVDDHVVDVRKESQTFGKALRFRLEPGYGALYIPPGIAHGWQAMAAMSAIVYLLDMHWSPDNERGLSVDDPAITWAMPKTVVSRRDREWPLLKNL